MLPFAERVYRHGGFAQGSQRRRDRQDTEMQVLFHRTARASMHTSPKTHLAKYAIKTRLVAFLVHAHHVGAAFPTQPNLIP